MMARAVLPPAQTHCCANTPISLWGSSLSLHVTGQTSSSHAHNQTTWTELVFNSLYGPCDNIWSCVLQTAWILSLFGDLIHLIWFTSSAEEEVCRQQQEGHLIYQKRQPDEVDITTLTSHFNKWWTKLSRTGDYIGLYGQRDQAAPCSPCWVTGEFTV